MRVIALTLALLVAMPSFAVEPDEILDDPVLEERARDLSGELRCLVCRNESIDESNAELARDLRLLVRERLLAGDTDDEVIAFLVERYGEYVLLRPSTSGSSILLWLAGPLMLLIAVGVGIGYIRGRKLATDPVEALSAEDQARLKALLKDE
ncbi:MAG: cytochrome c-type biogenesis protein CcmH [Dinoroseobacter sp.]|nr:cytochrome c-type biogenesis protein CcmH [Dinoroseobacter sp.]